MQIGWIISGSLALIAVITSFWLISKHLQWYTDRKEQRYIVRLLFMVPLYAIISFGSFLFWNHSTPIILVRDAYESIVLTAFFYLLLMYLSHDPEEQKRIFLKRGLSVEADDIARQKGEKVSQWVFPLGFVKSKPKDGLYFLQLMKWGVLQYCVIRPTTTLAAVILDYIGLYCESSWGLGWGHIYITIIISVSVSIAMYCLIQLYVPVAKELSMHKPLLKLFSVKAVVFLTFWQATFLSVLSMFGIVKDTKYMTADDVNIGIGAVLETFEMMIFAFVHIRAFTYQPYKNPSSKPSPGLLPSRTPQWRSLGHAMDFRETFREIWVGCVYMFDKMRGKEPKLDFGVIRESHYEGAFGRQRPLPGWFLQTDSKAEIPQEATLPSLEIEVDQQVEIEGQRQWLLMDNHDRRGHPMRERSESLQEQIDKELERLGYTRSHKWDMPTVKPEVNHQPGAQRSWWRNIYDRISQSGQEVEEQGQEPFKKRRLSHLRSHRRRRRLLSDTEVKDTDRDIDDQLTPGMLRPPSVQLPRNIGNPDYRRDQFFSENEDRMPPINEDRRMRRYQLEDQPIALPISPVSAGKRASRPPPTAYDPSDGPGGPYEPIIPVRSQADLSQENKIYFPILGRQPGPSRRPLRDSLVMPAPLDPRYHSDSRQSSFVWKPPSPPPKDHRGSKPHVEPATMPQHRTSVHRREPAAVPVQESRRVSHVFPPSTRVRHPGLPYAGSVDDHTYIT
ncbi:hypothetical protein GALMADRAFT_542138 [Galerina marginata CBS 339.88]|uniref:DUF300-domain-containing protein n=1 Tax=Galerina marginata (strain CBS 339.88) TaxID=685588 RepID=A0A067T8C4_GALM3|nr:hypothetical protein GALMADRAFT_542138 [Galerina marginata CBS 339.88]